MSRFLDRHDFLQRNLVYFVGACIFFGSILLVAANKHGSAQTKEVMVGYVVALDEHGKPALCYPVPERTVGTDIEIMNGGIFCFNGDEGTCVGKGAVAVSQPAIAWNPTSEIEGRAWLDGLGITSCPGGRIP